MITPSISSYNKKDFPDIFVSENQILDKSYGCEIAKNIYSSWVNDTRHLGVDFRVMVDELRNYAAGTQSVERYKTQLAGENPYMNISYNLSPILPSYITSSINRLMQQEQKPKIRSIDPYSFEQKKKKIYNDKVKMQQNKFFKELKQATGLDLSEKEDFKTEEELDVYYDLQYKQASELALELGVELITSFNDFVSIKRRVYKDLHALGRACMRTLTTPNGIKIVYVDIRNLVTAFSKQPDRKDSEFFGEIKTKSISEILIESGGELTLEDAKKIYATISSDRQVTNDVSVYSADNEMTWDNIKNFKVDVLEFEYMTFETINQIKKTDKFKRITYRQPDRDEVNLRDNEVMVEVNYQEAYEGTWIIGCDNIYGWKKATNVARPPSKWYNAISTYQYYQTDGDFYTINSLVNQCRGAEDNIQLALFTLQFLISKAKPKGVAADTGALENVKKGDKGFYSFLDIADIYQATGSYYYRLMDDDGNPMNYQPIKELEGGIGRALQEIQSVVQQNINLIESITGINQIAKGATPTKDALVGVNEIAVNASYNATDHMRFAFVEMYKSLTRSVALRIIDVLKYGDAKEYFMAALGSQTTALLENMNSLINIDFDVDVEVSPTEKERFEFTQDLFAAAQQGQIDYDDKLEIQEIKNLKYAKRILAIRKKQKAERDMQAKQQEFEMLSNQQKESAAITAEAEALKIRLKLEAEIEAKKKELETVEQYEKIKFEREKELIELKSKMKREEVETAIKMQGASGGSNKGGTAYGTDRTDVIANAVRVRPT